MRPHNLKSGSPSFRWSTGATVAMDPSPRETFKLPMSYKEMRDILLYPTNRQRVPFHGKQRSLDTTTTTTNNNGSNYGQNKRIEQLKEQDPSPKGSTKDIEGAVKPDTDESEEGAAQNTTGATSEGATLSTPACPGPRARRQSSPALCGMKQSPTILRGEGKNGGTIPDYEDDDEDDRLAEEAAAYLARTKMRRMSQPAPIKMRQKRVRSSTEAADPDTLSPLTSDPSHNKSRSCITLIRSRSIPRSMVLNTSTVSTKRTHKPIFYREKYLSHPTQLWRRSDSEDSDISESEGAFRRTNLRHTMPVRSPISTVSILDLQENLNENSTKYAEALWDHVTMDKEELMFRLGDVIEVLDMSDKHWWWGSVDGKQGWFPTAFVRFQVNQPDLFEESLGKFRDSFTQGTTQSHLGSPRQYIPAETMNLKRDQGRRNCINEILSTERIFVRNLRDVVDGYLREARKKTKMFSEQRVKTIFSNIEQIYGFQLGFLKSIEKMYVKDQPHRTNIGLCFIKNKEGFDIYSEYCNDHSAAISEVHSLYKDKVYKQFLESCRIKQGMIDISLDGFLLTPVQKICKYPLQLAELLKYTTPDHLDYEPVKQATQAMKDVAYSINEKKRKLESIAKISAWHKSIEGWEGPSILQTSSELIYSGDVTKVSKGLSQERTFFLFDHQLVYCKRDFLGNGYSYRGCVNIDASKIRHLEDGRNNPFNINVRNGWAIYNSDKKRWYVVCVKSPEEKQRWMRAFVAERKRVQEDAMRGYYVPSAIRQIVHANNTATTPKKPQKPRADKGLTCSGGANSGTPTRNPASSAPSSPRMSKKKSHWFPLKFW